MDGLRVEEGVIGRVDETQTVTVNVHVQVFALETDHKDSQLPNRVVVLQAKMIKLISWCVHLLVPALGMEHKDFKHYT